MRSFTDRGGWWVVAQLGAFAAAAAAGLARPAGFDAPPPLTAAGWLLLAAGAGLATWGLAALGPGLTPYPTPAAGADLVGAGPYRFVRHPIYGGIVVAAAGWGVVRADWLALAVAVALVPFFLAKAGYEERHLLQRYPDYAAYRRRVRRRLIPGLI